MDGSGRGRVATLNVRLLPYIRPDPFHGAFRGEAAAPGPPLSFRPVRARPYGAAMPLTLITGPANAAKAGAVLERLRAALPRDPVLVVPTSADATHYARELAGAGLVFGADVTTFPRLMRDIARTAGIRDAAAGPARPRAGGPRRDRATSSCARSRPRPPGPGFPDALGDLFAELQRSLASPGAVRRRGPRVASGRAAARRRARRALLRLPPPARGARGASTPTASRHLALNAVARGVGRPPAVPVRLRRAAAHPARPRRDARPPHRHRGHGRAHLRARPRRAGRQRRDGRAAQAARARARRARAALRALRAEDARGALHHLERSLFEPSPAPRAAQRRRPPARGGRRARRGRARRRLGARAAARRDGAGGHRGPRRAPAPTCSPRSSRATASRSPASAARRSRRPGSAPACSRSPAPRSGGTAKDVVTWLRTPGKLTPASATTELADRLEVQVRRARGAHRPRRAVALGAARRPRADRARRARRRRRASSRS